MKKKDYQAPSVEVIEMKESVNLLGVSNNGEQATFSGDYDEEDACDAYSSSFTLIENDDE